MLDAARRHCALGVLLIQYNIAIAEANAEERKLSDDEIKQYTHEIDKIIGSLQEVSP